VKRLALDNINTAQHFDAIWRMEGIHRFDPVRMAAFCKYVKPGDRILDVGAGRFGWAQYRLETALPDAIPIEAHAIDFSPEAVHTVTAECPELRYHLGDVLRMPFPSDHFDVVGAGELIEHMDVPADLAAEMARVTRIGGTIIIGTVDPDCQDSQGIEYPEHLWQFTPEDLVDLLSKYGPTKYERIGNYDHVVCQKAAVSAWATRG
jgi:ubiquinone/menaquinone biosynthesis C-methylase UbiE